MDIDAQIQDLIQNAPLNGVTPEVIEQGLAPALKTLAARLRHAEYYIVQTLGQDWAIAHLSHPTDPEITKTVIYAFPSLKATSSGPFPMQDPDLMALPLPVTHLLFQLLAMEQVDSAIFFESEADSTIGTEIQRDELIGLIQDHLSAAQLVPPSPSLPPNIA